MSSARLTVVLVLAVVLLSASLSSAQSADETWFGAAVMRGSYLYPQATGIILFGQKGQSTEVNIFVQIAGLPDGVRHNT